MLRKLLNHRCGRVTGLVFTVSTVLDTLPHVQRFVRGNLTGGVDHLVVLLDDAAAAGQAEVRAWLDEQPQVTCLGADEVWWAGDRPAQLNVRQRTNANLVKHVLAEVPDAAWLFHVDGDEIVRLDRDVLAGVPEQVPAVRLATLEAVSRLHWDGDPTWFKRALDEPDLALLATLGVIAKPQNGAYFHGHVEGKSGIRPGALGWLTLHKAVDDERELLEEFHHPSLQVLHYESYSGDDFVRKWTAMLASGPTASFRKPREEVATALRTLVAKDLDAEQVRPYLLRIFERTALDAEQTLRELGLLVEVDPLQGTHRPAALADDVRTALDAGLAEVATVPKRRFHSGASARKWAQGRA